MKKRNLAKAMLVLACSASLVACSGSGNNETTEAASTAETAATTEADSEEVKETEKEVSEGPMELRIGQVEGAAHGEKCFTVATAVIDANDTVVAAFIDDYQFLDAEQEGVPNSEAFIANGNVAEGLVLGSKRKNDSYYSGLMESAAGATMMISSNFDEIQAFVAGKTISELEELAGKSSEEVLDAVSSATLEDTPNYLGVIAEAAKAAKQNPSVVFEGNRDSLLLNVEEFAAHGDQCFTLAASLSDGDVVILSYVDEFQFMDGGQEGVPNSAAFTEDGSILDGKVLASKRVNNDYYSGVMKNAAGATVEIAANFDAVQEFVNGKSLMDLEVLVSENYVEDEEEFIDEEEDSSDDRTALEEEEAESVDAISGATLEDKWAYVAAILNSVG